MRDQLSEVCHKLDSIAKKSSPLNLKITGTHTSTHPDGKVLSTLVIENTVELQKLHEAILNEMSSIFTYEGVQKEMFYSPPPVNEIPRVYLGSIYNGHSLPKKFRKNSKSPLTTAKTR
jgi:hypothetical protein